MELQVPFGAELVHYAVGPATCGVPGVPAGLDALWRAHGRLPWPRLVEPARAVARDGADAPPAHAACLEMLEPVMTMNEGAAIYAPGGELLGAGERVHQPGLVRALELLADEGAGSVYSGTIGRRLLELSDGRGGLVTGATSRATSRSGESRRPSATPGRGSQPGWGSRACPSCWGGCRRSAGCRRPSASSRWPRPSPPLRWRVAHTTTALAVVDSDGNACALISSLGLGSGDWLPGLDLHLNSMLGEADLSAARSSRARAWRA